MTNVNAFDNIVHGLVIVNNHGTSTGWSDPNRLPASNNERSWFTVDTFGTILVSNGIVNGNGDHAAILHNDLVLDTAPKTVTVNGTQFNGNNGGLEIRFQGGSEDHIQCQPCTIEAMVYQYIHWVQRVP